MDHYNTVQTSWAHEDIYTRFGYLASDNRNDYPKVFSQRFVACHSEIYGVELEDVEFVLEFVHPLRLSRLYRS